MKIKEESPRLSQTPDSVDLSKSKPNRLCKLKSHFQLFKPKFPQSSTQLMMMMMMESNKLEMTNV